MPLLRGLVVFLLFSSISSAYASPQASNDPVAQERPTKFNLSTLGARGLVRTISPYTLEPGEFAFGFSLINYDRDPGDVDFKEYNLEAAVGLPGRMEIFVRYTPRVETNSVNLDPLAFPPPPFDLVVDTFPTLSFPSQPFLLFSQEAPYKTYFTPGVTISSPDRGAFGSSSGDLILGVKRNLLSETRKNRFGLGIQGYVKFPTEKPGFKTWATRPFVTGLTVRPDIDWRNKAGASGERDFGFDLLLSKQVRKAEILVNVGYRKVGDPEHGFRVHLVNSGASQPQDFVVAPPVEFALDLRDELQVVAGTSFPVFKVRGKQFWFVGEFYHKHFVGGGTRVQKLVHPVETTLGLQTNPTPFRWLSFGAAWVMQWNPAGHGGQRVSPFARNINFSEVVDFLFAGEVKTFLVSQGVPLFENTNGIFVTNNPAFDAWRNIPSQPTPVVSRGHAGAILFLTVRP